MATTTRAGLAMAALLSLSACGDPARPDLTEAQLTARSQADTAAMGQTVHHAVGKLIARAEAKDPNAPEPACVLNILAISGGGDYGAFGSGFLVGWGSVAEPKRRRPEFDVVTGVSTGALLAPFAFLGTDEAYQTVDSFYRDPKDDWLQERWPLAFLPYNASFMTLPGLERDVRHAIDEDFVRKIAAEAAKGKLLAVSATDLDLGRQRFWDVGAEAELAAKSGDPDRVQRMLLASAAIPAAFPPIAIDDQIYADGGVTANIFLRLDIRNPHAFLPRWKAEHPDRPLPKVRYWIIINNQLAHAPKTVQPKWPDVIGPSLEVAVRSATISEVKWLAAEADYVNAVYGTDVEVLVVAIPNDWRPPVEGGFKTETMDSLSDLGRKLGADPATWQVWTMPRNAAVKDRPAK